jgi:uncharacterized protein YggE
MIVALAAVCVIGFGVAGFVYAIYPRPPQSTLTVAGSGEAAAEPNSAKVFMGIIAEAKIAEEASASSAEIFSVLLRKLSAAGLARNQIETVSYSLNPVYEYPKEGRPILVGYKAEHRVLVTIFSNEQSMLGKKVGEAIDLAIEAGVTQVSNVQFSVSDSVLKELRERALKAAVLDAQGRCEAIVRALGLKILSVSSVSEAVYQPMPPPLLAFNSPKEAKIATELAPGPFKLQASVQVTYVFGQ